LPDTSAGKLNQPVGETLRAKGYKAQEENAQLSQLINLKQSLHWVRGSSNAVGLPAIADKTRDPGDLGGVGTLEYLVTRDELCNENGPFHPCSLHMRYASSALADLFSQYFNGFVPHRCDPGI
jgi:hypothetical protein